MGKFWLDIIIKMRQSCGTRLEIVRSQVHSGFSNNRLFGKIVFFTRQIGKTSNLYCRPFNTYSLFERVHFLRGAIFLITLLLMQRHIAKN